MHWCCRVIGPHTIDVGFHIHVGDEYYVFNYSGWLWCSVGIRGDDLEGDLVPHVSIVGLGTLHVFGCVIFVYVLDVNYLSVYLCAWWLVAIDEFYTCANTIGDNFWWCSFMNDEILCYLIMFIFSIMIDVKLTPSGLWWTVYLFVWMGRRRAGLVDLHCLVSLLEDSGSFLHLFRFVVS